MSNVAAFVKDLTLPTMPEVAHELIRSLNDDEIPMGKLKETIAKDPALTVKLLRLANSARFGVSREVSNLEDAMAVVGMSQVRTLALSACLNDAFPVAPGLNRDDFWRESQACAAYAQWLASRMGADSQQAWLSGFMVRLGELMIVQNHPEALATIEQEPHDPGGRWEREASLLGFTEGQITAEMARRWKFPQSIIDALEHSGDPLAVRPFCRLSGVLHLAELLSTTDPEASEEMVDVPQALLVALQLDREWLTAHMTEAREFAASATVH